MEKSLCKHVTKAKKQHYVPQFLLRNFSTGKKSKAKLWVLDKQSGKIYQASVRDIGHENQFYDYHGEAGDFELEDLMQKIDSKGAPLIESISKNRKLPCYPEDRVWLSYFVATQIVRTPMTRNEIKNILHLITHKWGDNIKVHPDDSKTIGEYSRDDVKVASLHLIANSVPECAKLLQEKVWSLCEAPTKTAYIISDNPVVRHNTIERWPRGNLGLLNEGIEVYMPLSPRYALHAICPKLAVAVAALRTPDLAVSYGRALEEGVPVMHATPNVEFVNSLQVIWAERFVYAKERKHLDMPLDMLRTNPELKDGPGVRAEAIRTR